MPVVRGRSIRVLYDEAAIKARNAELAAEIAASGYDNLLVISILKGSFVFAADLIRALHAAASRPRSSSSRCRATARGRSPPER